ncbi:MAG TPA: phosphatidylserine decarboxylase family protein [Mariprofundaceae bacterium]|nr:phosphatidylserine decarboxylase family protein [Mariprofundaceae bacterium]
MTQPSALTGRPRGHIPLAPQGWPFLLPALALLVLFIWLGWVVAGTILGLLFAFMLNFFRDPERQTPSEPGLFIAPADGRVVRAEPFGEAGGDGLRVDVFMNVFNVHVNRAPMSGRIASMEYTTGQFINAAAGNAGAVNERNRFEMDAEDGSHPAFTQIAGLVARRIVSYIQPGATVRAGQRIGMIRFGSRVDCEIPAGFELCVKVGDKVVAGETVLARKPEVGV